VNPFWITEHPVAIVVAVLLVFLLVRSVYVLDQFQRGVVLTLGRYTGTRPPGFGLLFPIAQTMRRMDLRVQTILIGAQETITSDNVSVKIDAVLWYAIDNPERAALEVADYAGAVVAFATTTLRNQIGRCSLDELLRDRERISEAMRVALDEQTRGWGVNVKTCEMRNIEVPPSMVRVMAQEAEATREMRARLIKASAELQASQQLKQAADLLSENPISLELRRMQMLTEIGVEQNTNTIILMPTEFVTAAGAFARMVDRKGEA